MIVCQLLHNLLLRGLPGNDLWFSIHSFHFWRDLSTSKLWEPSFRKRPCRLSRKPADQLLQRSPNTFPLLAATAALWSAVLILLLKTRHQLPGSSSETGCGHLEASGQFPSHHSLRPPPHPSLLMETTRRSSPSKTDTCLWCFLPCL